MRQLGATGAATEAFTLALHRAFSRGWPERIPRPFLPVGAVGGREDSKNWPSAICAIIFDDSSGADNLGDRFKRPAAKSSTM